MLTIKKKASRRSVCKVKTTRYICYFNITRVIIKIKMNVLKNIIYRDILAPSNSLTFYYYIVIIMNKNTFLIYSTIVQSQNKKLDYYYFSPHSILIALFKARAKVKYCPRYAKHDINTFVVYIKVCFYIAIQLKGWQQV